MKKKKITKENIIAIGVVGVLIAIFAGLFSYGLSSVLAMEGAFPPNINEEGLTPAPQTKEDALELLNRAVNNAVEENPKLDTADNFEVNTETLETSGSEHLKATLIYIRDDFDSQLDSNFKSISTQFGDELKGKLNLPQIATDDIIDFKCDYIFYQCSSCGAESDVQHPNCEECGNAYEYQKKYRDEYTLTLTIKDTDKNLDSDFNRRTHDEALALCGDCFNNTLNVNELNISYDELCLVFKVERLTDKLTYLDFQKKMTVNAKVNFIGKYSELGEASTSFELTENNSFTITWPGISLSENEKTIEPNGTDNLLPTLTCTDPLNYTVVWESSDESLVTVDEEGYLKALDKTGTAIITASFEFNGKKYSAECSVNVKYSVESSKISDKKLKMNVGEAKELEITVSPNNATIKTVTWYTENEKIAAVDENGTVRAIAPGTVTVYSLTDDGYFKSSCEVTVE